MAQNVEFRISLLVDGKENVVSSAEDVKQLAKEHGIAKDSGEGLRDTLLTFNYSPNPSRTQPKAYRN